MSEGGGTFLIPFRGVRLCSSGEGWKWVMEKFVIGIESRQLIHLNFSEASERNYATRLNDWRDEAL